MTPVTFDMTPVTFDLMTPKSNQVVVPPICIHDLSLKLICQKLLQLSREQAIHNNDLLSSLPQNLIRSLSIPYAYMIEVWSLSAKRFLSYRKNEKGTDGQPENTMPW